MRLPIARLALCAAGLSLFALTAAPASAATGPTVLNATDPKGDALAGQGDMDIVGLTFMTGGTTVTKKVGGKTTKVYTPKRLIMKLTLSAPPSELPVFQAAIDATTSACGSMSLYYDGLDLASGGFTTECGSEGTDGNTFYFDSPVVEGNSVVWTQPFTTLPKEIATGSFTEIQGYTSINEPNTGVGTSFVTSAANVDNLVVEKAYKVG